MDEVLTMAGWEIDRLHVIRQVLEKRLTWSQAAEQLELTERQIGRICARVRGQGSRGVIHKLRGRPSNRQFAPELLERVLGILHDRLWKGFKPTFASEKLQSLHGITISEETLRKLMIKAGLWHHRRRRAPHRQWRERRACVGMLVQLDGSIHDWFEGRGPKCVLIAFIDDATSRILHAEFAASEDTISLLRATKTYLEADGRPVALYVDKDSIYRINNRKTTTEDDLLGRVVSTTQYERAMAELNIKIIWADSPQAKGRVERSFQTHQDRLVKELRLAGISTIAGANVFLRERYLPAHNDRFAVDPASPQKAHRPLRSEHRLDEILSVREPRTVFNNFTIQFNNNFYQILAPKPLGIRPKAKLFVETRLDGTIHLRHGESYLSYKKLAGKPHTPFCVAERKHIAKNVYPTRVEVERTKGQLTWLGFGKKSRDRPETAFECESLTAPSFI